MSFMQPHLTNKARLYSADCAHCGASIFAHEHATNETADDLKAGTAECDQCSSGKADPETFTDCGLQYAARYSAPGYMDCTDWSYGPNKRQLLREVRDMYGED